MAKPYLLCVFFAFSLLVLHLKAQECSSAQFAIRKGSEDYLLINSPTEVRTCGGRNICNSLAFEPVLFRAEVTSSETILQGGVVPISFDVATFDTAGGFVPGAGVYTIPSDGWYQVSASLNFNAEAGRSFYITLEIFSSNSVLSYCRSGPTTITGYPYMGVQCTDIFQLEQGAVVGIRTFVAGGGAVSTVSDGGCFFTVHKISN